MGVLGTYRLVYTMQAISTILLLSVSRASMKVSTIDKITLTEMVSYKLLILKGMLSTDSHNRLVGIQRPVGRLAGGFPPSHFLLEHVKQSNDIAETAAVSV